MSPFPFLSPNFPIYPSLLFFKFLFSSFVICCFIYIYIPKHNLLSSYNVACMHVLSTDHLALGNRSVCSLHTLRKGISLARDVPLPKALPQEPSFELLVIFFPFITTLLPYTVPQFFLFFSLHEPFCRSKPSFLSLVLSI